MEKHFKFYRCIFSWGVGSLAPVLAKLLILLELASYKISAIQISFFETETLIFYLSKFDSHKLCQTVCQYPSPRANFCPESRSKTFAKLHIKRRGGERERTCSTIFLLFGEVQDPRV